MIVSGVFYLCPSSGQGTSVLLQLKSEFSDDFPFLFCNLCVCVKAFYFGLVRITKKGIIVPFFLVLFALMNL